MRFSTLCFADGAFSIDRIYNLSLVNTFDVTVKSHFCNKTYVVLPNSYTDVGGYNCMLADHWLDDRGTFIVRNRSTKHISQQDYTLHNKYWGFRRPDSTFVNRHSSPGLRLNNFEWSLTFGTYNDSAHAPYWSGDAWFYLYLRQDGLPYAKDYV